MYNNRRRLLGLVVFIASILFLVIYAWLLFVSDYSIMVIKYTVFAFVAGLIGLLAWLGLTLTTAVKDHDNIEMSNSNSVIEKKDLLLISSYYCYISNYLICPWANLPNYPSICYPIIQFMIFKYITNL